MAELEIDQSNLPRVQEVCQSFAVLEDGALAHNLQEQEIEQYYTTNIQKNQLVQNDIRVAKRLQDEEEEQRAQQSALLKQTTKQIEEQDFEYACMIQEELQRHAEEAHRREQSDEEIAKRLQEEEEQGVRRRSRGHEGHSEGSSSDPELSPHQHTLSRLHQEEQSSPITTRWQYSTSQNGRDLTGPQTSSPRRVAAQINTTSWSNQGHADSIRQARDQFRETLSEDSEDSDTVFTKQLSMWSQRLFQRHNTTPHREPTSSRQPHQRKYKSLCSRSSFTNEFKGCEQEVEGCDEDFYEDNDQQKRISRNLYQESNHRDENEGWHRRRDQDTDCVRADARERRCSRSESVRIHNRSTHRSRDLSRTWSYKDNPDKHVRFQDDKSGNHRQQSESSKVWEMLGHILRERGVPVRVGGSGAPLQILPQSRDSQVLQGSEVSCSDSQPHQRAFQRAATTRHSFHGDIRERRRMSHRENSGRDHREDRDRHHDNGEVYEIPSRNFSMANRDRQGSRRWKEHKFTHNEETGRRNSNDNRVRRTTSERSHWHRITEERLSSEQEQEQEVERRVEHPRRRALQRSQSLSSRSSSRASTRHRSRHIAAGALLEPSGTSLDLGELHQVLQDEELARILQEEEETLLRRNSQPSPPSSYPEGDFRVAQVAQDEEIAHFMQKQEIKSKRRSRELEGPASWREHRAMISHHDRQAARERKVQRERLDSEGLPSPTEDCSPENQPPSPIHVIPNAQQIRNIAEELDPTFQARRHSTERQAGPACGSLPMPQSGLHDFLEEPTFIPPTKRQTEKSRWNKPKEKKENCKQQ
ncbi:coiled-coil domain-containing protein 187 isoform X1 [Melanotaenia boesemani]|uniref:coiled-coil domain-containing protein 187 isoform X1 n=1 Tax=Melanotaenia boesemani TaxID=1250792 RepID=UPI001C042B70|nr:coiled-coil domain-containing protein 187 isoform X1 [Melanotaenia boesemani]XP_041859683.1 coiled-coil domain-containing protein 187 isoform X1 [Melanotaenia boesemani]XP_041859684.1 coiled-coil domain-containing protein 187 isoform X1 [Melanotaenia boesemani]